MKPIRLLAICLLLMASINTAYAQSYLYTISNTFATSSGVGMDAAGNMYVAEYNGHKVKKIDAVTGVISIMAGTGLAGFSGDGGPATSATIDGPRGIFVTPAGDIFIADGANGRIRRVDHTTGLITTICGGGNASFSEGVIATNLQSSDKFCVFVDEQNYIYTEHGNRIIKIHPFTGQATTVLGNGTSGDSGDGGLASAAGTSGAKAIYKDAAGNLYVVSQVGDRIRKVDVNTGIINTVVGGGSNGLGDGGQATNAEIVDVNSFAVDMAGNIYVADRGNFRIRKVDAVTGIIYTLLGNGTSSIDSNGTPALQAYGSSYQIILDAAGGNIIYSNTDPKLRKLTNVNIDIQGNISDSFHTFIAHSCGGPSLTTVTEDYTPGMTVQTNFGDGIMDTTTVVLGFNTGYAPINHVYQSSGAYTIKQVLYYGTDAIDSLQFVYNHLFCSTMSLQFYNDGNSNCSYEIGPDYTMFLPMQVEIDSNNVSVDTISCTSGFTYTAYGNPGDVYKFKILELPGDMIATCPVTGIISDTLQSGINATKNMGLSCSLSGTYDYSVYTAIPVTGANDQWGHIYITNTHSYGPNATLTLQHSPKYHYAGNANPAPAAYTNNTLAWNLSNITANNAGPTSIYFVLLQANGPLMANDTVQNRITINPTTGDANPQDNSIIVIDTVDASCDPNAIYVKPEGCVEAGTNLEYKITFENIGNAPAENIYVLDTLPVGVNPSSMKLKFASHNMYVEKIYSGSLVILKFNFPNIMLPDSSDHEGCHGMFIYTIDSKSNFPSGALISHRAGIYFDYNDPVMTNTAQTMICWPASVAHVEKTNKAIIFPNPADDELIVQSPQPFTDCIITNNIGQVLQRQSINTKEARLNIKSLPAGIYYINIRGNGINEVQKFLKR